MGRSRSAHGHVYVFFKAAGGWPGRGAPATGRAASAPLCDPSSPRITSNLALRAALAGGPEVRFLQLSESPGGAREAPGTALTLPGCSVSSVAWSPDGRLFALATQVGLPGPPVLGSQGWAAP